MGFPTCRAFLSSRTRSVLLLTSVTMTLIVALLYYCGFITPIVVHVPGPFTISSGYSSELIPSIHGAASSQLSIETNNDSIPERDALLHSAAPAGPLETNNDNIPERDALLHSAAPAGPLETNNDNIPERDALLHSAAPAGPLETNNDRVPERDTLFHSAAPAEVPGPQDTNNDNSPVPPKQSANANALKLRSGNGYVIVLDFYEQQTMATQNLLELEVWAAMHNLKVVEPFVYNSCLRFSFNESHASKMVKMGDMYDMTDWEKFAKSNTISSIVKRETFLNETSHFQKNVILVQILYGNPCTFARHNESGLDLFMKGNEYLTEVRRQCISNDQPSAQAFSKLVFGEVSPRDSVVIINEWRGFGAGRVNFKQMLYSKAKTYMTQKVPSNRILKDAESYAQKHLGGFGNYIALMGRFEKPVNKYWSIGVEKRREAVKQCMKSALQVWNEMKRKTSTLTTFLTFDYGKFGSQTYKSSDYLGSEDDLRQFHHTIYGDTWTVEEWEQSFVDISHMEECSYYSIMQAVIAAHAKGIILVGRSNFHKYLSALYVKNHPHGVHLIEHVCNW